MYKPGTHIITTLYTEELIHLRSYHSFKNVTGKLINQFDLECLGEVYHNFDPAGYTGVVCLSESHISIHTWPEYGLLNMDIYLSNYQRSNDETVKKIFAAYVEFFKAEIRQHQTITR